MIARELLLIGSWGEMIIRSKICVLIVCTKASVTIKLDR